MSTVQTLIDKAKGDVLSLRGLAGALAESPGFLSRVSHGLAPLPPGLAARLAARAGENPVQATLRAVVDAEQDTLKRAELEHLLLVQGWRKRSLPNFWRAAFRRLKQFRR